MNLQEKWQHNCTSLLMGVCALLCEHAVHLHVKNYQYKMRFD